MIDPRHLSNVIDVCWNSIGSWLLCRGSDIKMANILLHWEKNKEIRKYLPEMDTDNIFIYTNMKYLK